MLRARRPRSLTLRLLHSQTILRLLARSHEYGRRKAITCKWGWRRNPTAGYSASEIGDEGQAGQQGGVVGQELVMGHKLKLNRAVAASEVHQIQLELDAQRQRVLNDVRVQFYNVLIAQQKVSLADAS